MTKSNFLTQCSYLRSLRNISMLVLGLILCSAFSASAQSVLNFDKKEGISIPEQVSMTYDMDLELGDHFTKAQDAVDYFKRYNTPITTATLDTEKGMVTISFEFRAKPDWTKKEWNTYLKSLTKKS